MLLKKLPKNGTGLCFGLKKKGTFVDALTLRPRSNIYQMFLPIKYFWGNSNKKYVFSTLTLTGFNNVCTFKRNATFYELTFYNIDL